MISAITLYTLITVTNGGDVHQTPGFKTLHMCEEAKSISQTGMTIEEVKARQAAKDAAEKLAAERWYKAHPPRKPQNAGEREIAKFEGCTFWDGGGLCSAGHGLVQDQPSGVISSITIIPPPPGDIKWARCVIESP